MIGTLLAALSMLVLVGVGLAWKNFGGTGMSVSNAIRTEKGSDGAVDILLVGMDSRTDVHGNPIPQHVLDSLRAGSDGGGSNTDTLVLLHIPNDRNKKSSAISIPRDSYVNIPGFGKHKINSAYARAASQTRERLEGGNGGGNSGGKDKVPPRSDAAITRQADQAGRVSLIHTVQHLTGATIDHYAEINLLGFAEITNAVGGVDVCLNQPVHDRYSGANFRAGWQTLEGTQGLRFVRQRHGLPRGDLDRIARQQAFMAGLVDKVLSTGTLANPHRLARLSDAVEKSVVLDKGWDLFGFAQQMQGLTGDRIRFATIPTGSLAMETPDDGDAVEVEPREVKRFVTTLTEGKPSDGVGHAEGGPPGDGAAPNNPTGRSDGSFAADATRPHAEAASPAMPSASPASTPASGGPGCVN